MLATSCIVVAAAMPYVFVMLTGLPARSQKARWGGGYDNREPREYLAGLAGWRRRARAGEANSHEAFAPFAVERSSAPSSASSDASLNTSSGPWTIGSTRPTRSS